MDRRSRVAAPTRLAAWSIGRAPLTGIGTEPIGVEFVALAVAQAIVNMACAGAVVGLVERIVNRFADEEISRRSGLSLGYSGRSRP